MKKLLPQLAFVFLLLLPLLGRAQETHISGRVVDAGTKDPVPFASVILRSPDIGALTDEQGFFQFVGLESFKPDSVIVMTLGYDRCAVFIKNNISDVLTIELTHRNVEILGIGGKLICRPLTDKDLKPIIKSEQIAGTSGTQYAFFIANEKQNKLGKLRTVSFYIGENGFPMEPFRIRIYKADGNYYSPKTDLLNVRVFLTATRAGEWHTSDLSRYSIDVPEHGFFVALEFGKPDNTFSQPVLEDYVASGLILRPDFRVNKSRIWNCALGSSWRLFSQPVGTSRYNAMVKAEVEATN